MRKALRESFNKVSTYYAHFIYYDNKKKIALIKDIKNEEGEFLSDHMWVDIKKDLDVQGLKKGDYIELKAKVTTYSKRKEVAGEEDKVMYVLDYCFDYARDIRRAHRKEITVIKPCLEMESNK